MFCARRLTNAGLAMLAANFTCRSGAALVMGRPKDVDVTSHFKAIRLWMTCCITCAFSRPGYKSMILMSSFSGRWCPRVNMTTASVASCKDIPAS